MCAGFKLEILLSKRIIKLIMVVNESHAIEYDTWMQCLWVQPIYLIYNLLIEIVIKQFLKRLKYNLINTNHCHSTFLAGYEGPSAWDETDDF